MKKKLEVLATIYILGMIGVFFFSCKIFFLMLILLFLGCFSGGFLFCLNKAYLKTNHWKNQFSFTKNFISNNGYRDNLGRNLDVVNLGSNPALNGFFS